MACKSRNLNPSPYLQPNPPHSSTRNAQQSLFLRLPAELRHQIHHHIFADEVLTISRISEQYSGVQNSSFYEEWVGRAFTMPTLLRLLFVCRQVYHEARLVPFSAPVFSFTAGDEPRLGHELDRLTEQQRRHISSVRLVTWNFMSMVCSWREPIEGRSAEASTGDLSFLNSLPNVRRIEVFRYEDGCCEHAGPATSDQEFEVLLIKGMKEDFNYRAWLERRLRAMKPGVEIVFTQAGYVGCRAH